MSASKNIGVLPTRQWAGLPQCWCHCIISLSVCYNATHVQKCTGMSPMCYEIVTSHVKHLKMFSYQQMFQHQLTRKVTSNPVVPKRPVKQWRFPTLSTLPASQCTAQTIMYWWWLLLLEYLNIFINSVKINASVCHWHQSEREGILNITRQQVCMKQEGTVTQWDMHASNVYPSSFCFPAQDHRGHQYGEFWQSNHKSDGGQQGPTA